MLRRKIEAAAGAWGGTMPIPKRTGRGREQAGVREDVLATLREAIISGILLPGESLVVDKLGEWLAVSSTPIRDALAILAAQKASSSGAPTAGRW